MPHNTKKIEITYKSKHNLKANNKYMKNYDKSKQPSYIQYLDANNLYGAAMSEKLPINGFKWVNDISGINKKFVKSYDKKNSDKGYILEVGVDYPSKLHKLYSDMVSIGSLQPC